MVESHPYEDVTFPMRPDRPWTVINMVTTIDGKSVTGTRNEPVADLGSSVDHAAMRHLERICDAVLVGAGNLRATPKMWFPEGVTRLVATQSGKLDPTARFFTDDPNNVYAICPVETQLPEGIRRLSFGTQTVEWPAVMSILKKLRIHHLLVEGGANLNAELFHEHLIDELFLTIAPKIKLGKDTPTYADGLPLQRDDIQNFTLTSHQVVGNEIFLRYTHSQYVKG